MRGTLPSQVNKIERRFGRRRVIVVSDRGIATKDSVTLISEIAEFAFITALKAPQVRKLVKEGCLQVSMFDQLNLAGDRLRDAVSPPPAGRVPQPTARRTARPPALRAAGGHREGCG